MITRRDLLKYAAGGLIAGALPLGRAARALAAEETRAGRKAGSSVFQPLAACDHPS